MLNHWTQLPAEVIEQNLDSLTRPQRDPVKERDYAAKIDQEISEERTRAAAPQLVEALRRIAHGTASAEEMRAIACEALTLTVERRKTPRPAQ